MNWTFKNRFSSNGPRQRDRRGIVALLVWGITVSLMHGQTDLAALRTRADQGEPEAINALANNFAGGQGVPQNYTEAIRLYQLAADRGLAVAHFNLGLLHETGRGVAPDAATAFKFYLKAAEQGITAAQFNVGNMYANGIGVGEDLFEALLWFRQAADRGLPEAQYNLALAYERGRGVGKDEVVAQRWYRAAAAQGNTRAQYNLGLMLEEGRGAPADASSAVDLYRAAAVQNFAPAQNNLGIMLAAGRGTPPNVIEAYKWLALAVENGMNSTARDAVARQLTSDELAAANASLMRARSLVAPKEPAPVSGAIIPGAVATVLSVGATAPSSHSPPETSKLVGEITDIPLPQLAASDPRIARLIHENARLNQDVVRTTLRLVQANRQLQTLQDKESARANPPFNFPPAAPDRSLVADLTSRINVLRGTVAKLAEENRWYYAAAAETNRLRAQNEQLKADQPLRQ